MQILIINLGNYCDCFVSTSIIKALKSENENVKIDCVVKNEKIRSIFKYNKKIRNVFTKAKFKKAPPKTYDKLINLDPSNSIKIKAKEKVGFGYSNDKKALEILYGNKKTNKNIFQVYFSLAQLKWRGESYDFYYHPKTKTKKDKTGLYLSNTNLKRYIVQKMELNESTLWIIPYHENVFKRIDEINRCNNIITDDTFTMHISVFLRKHVFFLKTLPQNTKIELFGKGNVFPVPPNLIK